MNSKDIYSIIISSKVNIITSKIYFEKKFPLYNFQWKDIYALLRKITINAYLRSFQHNILNSIPWLNKKLQTFGLSNTQLCSFCKMEKEKISYLLCYCIPIQDIWNQIQFYFTNCFRSSGLTSKHWLKQWVITYVECVYKIPKKEHQAVDSWVANEI